MKKSAFVLMLVCLTASVFAQLTLSPVAGANFSNVTSPGLAGFSTHPVLRYYIGFQASYGLSEKISAGVGFQYATKGYRQGDFGSVQEMQWRGEYFEFTPFVEYRLLQMLGVYAGANLGLLKDEMIKIDDKWQSPFIDLTEKTDMGALIGIRLYTKKAFFNLAYCHGFLPLSQINYTDENGNPVKDADKQYSRTLSIGVGYNFHLKKK